MHYKNPIFRVFFVLIYLTVQQLHVINVHLLNNKIKCTITMDNNQDNLNILRKIQNKSNITQRDLANELGFSLGKLNYCLKALKNKGLIKIKNIEKNNSKINLIYVLTPKGIAEKTKLTINFMKKKMKEYDELQKELDEKGQSVKLEV